MVARGLLRECKWLWDRGMRAKTTSASNAIGYRQGLEFLARVASSGGSEGLDKKGLIQLASEIQANTRNLTRKQNTWFRTDRLFRWVRVPANDAEEPTVGSFAAREILDRYSERIHEGGNGIEFELSDAEKLAMKRYRTKFLLLEDREVVRQIVEYVKTDFLKEPSGGEMGPAAKV